MNRKLLLFSLLTACLVGCSSPPSTASKGPAASEPGISEPPAEPSKPAAPEPAPKTSPPPKPLTAAQAKDPVAVAGRVDQMIRSLHNVQASMRTRMRIGEGSGNNSTIARFDKPGTFDITYLAFDGRKPLNAVLRADGKRVGELMEGKPVSPGEQNKAATAKEMGWSTAPVGKLVSKPASADPFKPFDIPRTLFAGPAEGKASFSNYITALQKAGYKLTVQQTATPFEGRVIRNYRIKGAKGGNRLEIVVDADLFLPVTISADAPSVDGKPHSLRWSTAWKNGVTFDKSDFNLPPD